MWYSGSIADLWIEYKYLGRIPKRKVVDVPPLLSALQRKWLINRCEEGRYVAVIVGCPNGGVILPGRNWQITYSAREFSRTLLSRTEIAKWIVNITTEKMDVATLFASPFTNTIRHT